MKFMSHLGSTARKDRANAGNGSLQYESSVSIRSTAAPGVTFVIHRVSFGRRMELSRRVREISRRAEFLEAGENVQEKIEAGILKQEIEAMYLRWGLVSIHGLAIDGEPADCERLIEKGPEELVGEIVRAVKSQCGLSEAEIKN